MSSSHETSTSNVNCFCKSNKCSEPSNKTEHIKNSTQNFIGFMTPWSQIIDNLIWIFYTSQIRNYFNYQSYVNYRKWRKWKRIQNQRQLLLVCFSFYTAIDHDYWFKKLQFISIEYDERKVMEYPIRKIWNIIQKIEWVWLCVYKGQDNLSLVKDRIGNRWSGLCSWYESITFCLSWKTSNFK